MDYLNEEERIREAELYEEMKDLKKLRKIYYMKINVFEQRRFRLRGLILKNLKDLVHMQIKALDEEYNLIGLDKECWTDEEHFLHDLENKIEMGNNAVHTKEQKESIIKRAIDIELREEQQIELLITLIKQYTLLIYSEIKKMDLENLFDIKTLFLEEGKKIGEIGRIINLEEGEEERVSRKNL